jgi:membrane protein YqaA with SNARE-associated domain
MLRRTYDWVMGLARSRHARAWLAAIAFAEGVCSPIAPDMMLMPVVLAHRDKAWQYAAITTAASVLGGLTGYGVGYFLAPVAHWLMALTGHGGDQAGLETFYQHWGVLMLALPIPYKFTAIASGLFHLNLPLFLAASVLVRGARFCLVAGLIKAYGAPIQAFIEKRLALVAAAVAVLIVAVVLALKYVRL